MPSYVPTAVMSASQTHLSLTPTVSLGSKWVPTEKPVCPRLLLALSQPSAFLCRLSMRVCLWC